MVNKRFVFTFNDLCASSEIGLILFHGCSACIYNDASSLTPCITIGWLDHLPQCASTHNALWACQAPSLSRPQALNDARDCSWPRLYIRSTPPAQGRLHLPRSSKTAYPTILAEVTWQYMEAKYVNQIATLNDSRPRRELAILCTDRRLIQVLRTIGIEETLALIPAHIS